MPGQGWGKREKWQAKLSDQGNGNNRGLTREDGERRMLKQKEDKIMVRMSENAANYLPKKSLIIHISLCINMHIEFK